MRSKSPMQGERCMAIATLSLTLLTVLAALIVAWRLLI